MRGRTVGSVYGAQNSPKLSRICFRLDPCRVLFCIVALLDIGISRQFLLESNVRLKRFCMAHS
jgi:hypothetical protein